MEVRAGTYQYLHLIQHTVRSDQVVRNTHSVWFHRVTEAICVRADIPYQWSVRRVCKRGSLEGVPS